MLSRTEVGRVDITLNFSFSPWFQSKILNILKKSIDRVCRTLSIYQSVTRVRGVRRERFNPLQNSG